MWVLDGKLKNYLLIYGLLGIYGFNGSAVIRRMTYGFKVKMFPFKSIEDLRDIDPYLLNDEIVYPNISFESLKTIIISELEKYNANFVKGDQYGN